MVLKFVFTAVKVNYFVDLEIHHDFSPGCCNKSLVILGQ
jgi:hypothetical protein